MLNTTFAGGIREYARKTSNAAEFLIVNQAIAAAEDRNGNLDGALTQISKSEEPTQGQILKALAEC